jgi:hypothetical protein
MDHVQMPTPSLPDGDGNPDGQQVFSDGGTMPNDFEVAYIAVGVHCPCGAETHQAGAWPDIVQHVVCECGRVWDIDIQVSLCPDTSGLPTLSSV